MTLRLGSLTFAVPAASAIGLVLVAAGLLTTPLPSQRGVDAGPDTSGPASTEIRDLRATLRDEERTLPDGRIAWSTEWRLCWTPVRLAVAYAVTPVSFEGPGRAIEVREPCYALSVANGVDDRPGQRSGRTGQLSLIGSSLAVSVAARFADGTLGPGSADHSVGREIP